MGGPTIISIRNSKSVPSAAVLALILMIPAQLLRAQGGAAGSTVITGGTLIDGTGKPPLANAAIVIEGNKITAVGEIGKVAIPSGAKTIDARGKFIIPGLFDSHVHYRNYVPELLLANGVTSVIDMGNPVDYILAQRDAINEGKISGPRIFASGEALSEASNGGGPTASGWNSTAPVGNAEEVRRTVQRLIAKGVDKISVNISLNPDLFPPIVEEAHKAGIPISAYTMFPREEVAMGLDIIEHSYSISAGTKADSEMLAQMRRERGLSRYEKHPLYYMADAQGSDQFIQLLVQKGTYVIPSLVFEYKLIHDRVDEFKAEHLALLQNPDLRYLPYDDYLVQVMNTMEGAIPKLGGPGFFGSLNRKSEEYSKYQAGYRRLQQFLMKLENAGGNILVGTDAPNLLPPGITLHQEMQLLVDAGLTPMQVLIDATRKPAAAMHKANILGTIEVGKLADLLILRANPLEDIRNTRSIQTVIQGGAIVDTTFHATFTNPIPRPMSGEAEYNPTPVLRGILPMIATEGEGDLPLTLQGANFTKESSVEFDGLLLQTTFVSERQLKATIPAQLLMRVGTYAISVSTPKPGGGNSGEIKFVVKYKL